ncbi:DUF1801 domain-containing protein [Flavimarina sp. Hel_I_48]|uniref:DUF1801 domain-containing protein n=1 Tax=Flavimarina sp. Hel_I_48 TaxID=1392488 RepID=UPI0004DF4C8D|nr:DUF1801 domain-containing protein [Flavimarina sp. Hel_I_48]
MDTAIEVETFFNQHTKHQLALQRLREIMRDTILKEDYRYNAPVYTYDDREVVGLSDANDHFDILFFNGDSLSDIHNVLLDTNTGTTNSTRQLRYTSVQQMNDELIKTYVEEAILNQSEAKIVQKATQSPDLNNCAELQNAFALSKHLKDRFMLLSNDVQQEYLEYLANADDEEDRAKRLEHCLPFIMRLRRLDKKML